MNDPKRYRPTSGSEGCWFIGEYCENCIHGKYEHTGKIEDRPCEILSLTFALDIKHEDYPPEWVVLNGKPTCTAFVKWDWNQDDDGNWIDPPTPPIDDPRQLVLPFIFDEIGIKNTTTNVQQTAICE